MYIRTGLTVVVLAAAVKGQQPGNLTAEIHPKLTTQTCTKASGCTSTASSITLDSNWRFLHKIDTVEYCYSGNSWNPSICYEPAVCAKNCALEGADYGGTYGITTSGNAITLKYLTQGNVAHGSRVFLLASDTAYQLFSIKNQELSFDVDTSNLPCGLNGALYFTQMDADGGQAKYANNKAGAKFGTGYCSGACPRDVKFINGEANILNWQPDSNDSTYGTGQYGSCCQEMDVWESNKQATTLIAHPCSVSAQSRCLSGTCDPYTGYCDRDGCDFNPYRNGAKTFYGPGLTIDTTKKVTVTTQWITSDGTAGGQLVEIRRKYIQNNKVIVNTVTNIPTVTPVNSITDAYCDQQKAAFGDPNRFRDLGGLAATGTGKYVLTMSIWDDNQGRNLWLDSVYPPTADPTKPGVTRGTCPTTPPATLPVEGPASSIVFSNIKFGDINSTTTIV